MTVQGCARGKRIEQSSGFTLIELLVVVAIIAVLAAIAIPQFVSYRSRAIDAQMKADLRNAASAMESYYAIQFIYPISVSSISAAGFTQTAGVTLTITLITLFSYTLNASKPNGSQPSFTFDSITGEIN